MTVGLGLQVGRRAARKLTPDVPQGPFRQGVVVGVAGSTVTLLIGASATPIPGVKVLVGYYPRVGDTVIVGYMGPTPWVVGSHTARSTIADTTICTSSTRPVSPTAGDTIYETNTGYMRIWNGTRWVAVAAEQLDALVATSQTTTSTSYADLATVGPTVTIDTDTEAEVSVYSSLTNSGTSFSQMAFAVSGATTVAANDNMGINLFGSAGSGGRVGATFKVAGLTPGSNVFTAKYKVGAGTGTYADRRLVVRPL